MWPTYAHGGLYLGFSLFRSTASNSDNAAQKMHTVFAHVQRTPDRGHVVSQPSHKTSKERNCTTLTQPTLHYFSSHVAYCFAGGGAFKRLTNAGERLLTSPAVTKSCRLVRPTPS
ncbi:unnamed protein product [Ectocarpus sp. 6 AP-2014]